MIVEDAEKQAQAGRYAVEAIRAFLNRCVYHAADPRKPEEFGGWQYLLFDEHYRNIVALVDGSATMDDLIRSAGLNMASGGPAEDEEEKHGRDSDAAAKVDDGDDPKGDPVDGRRPDEVPA